MKDDVQKQIDILWYFIKLLTRDVGRLEGPTYGPMLREGEDAS